MMESTEQFSFELSSEDFLSTAVFDKICRACLSTKGTTNMFKIYHKGLSFHEIFQSCASVQIKKNDSLPQNICKSCIQVLLQLYSFKQQCQRSDILLQTVLNQEIITKQEQVNVETEISIEEVVNSKIQQNALPKKSVQKIEDRVENDKKSKQESYLCKQCNETFDTDDELKTHRQQVKHPRRHKYICPVCYKPFYSNYLRLHMRIHTQEKPFLCQICKKRFTLKTNLRRHMYRHTGERPHLCEICGKGFIQTTALEEHKRIHTGETPFVCSYCGMFFINSSTYKLHLRRHLIKNDRKDKFKKVSYECSKCHQLYSSKFILKVHMLTHGKESFLCSYCGKGFFTLASLISHNKIHLDVKPYVCTVCYKTFSQKSSLNSHLLIHTGQKPFVCKVCAKPFNQRSHVNRHMRTHTGEKPHACTYCSKSFALKENLRVHIRIHTGETPFVCDICNKGFYDSSSMKRHRRGQHGEINEMTMSQNVDSNIDC